MIFFHRGPIPAGTECRSARRAEFVFFFFRERERRSYGCSSFFSRLGSLLVVFEGTPRGTPKSILGGPLKVRSYSLQISWLANSETEPEHIWSVAVPWGGPILDRFQVLSCSHTVDRMMISLEIPTNSGFPSFLRWCRNSSISSSKGDHSKGVDFV